MFKLDKLIDKVILTIYGYIGGYYFDYRTVSDALNEITREGYTRLDLHMHTYGGFVFDGNLIHNFLSSFKGDLNIYIDGVAASMGAVLIMSGGKVHIAENGFIMIHAPRGGVDGTAKDMEQYAKLLRSMEKNFNKKLKEKTGKTEKEINAWMDGTDYWFDAEESLKLGLVDSIFETKTKDNTLLNKTEVAELGAKAVYDKFVALTIPQNSNKNKNEMDKKALIARYGLTTVTEASTDDQVMAAIDTKIQEGKDQAQTAERKLQETQKASIASAVDAAISASKISKEKREEYIVRGEKIGLDELNSIFNDMQVYQTITDKLDGKNTQGNGSKPDRKGWDWDKYQKEASAELEAMAKTDPETFKALYKAKFGKETEI